MLEENCSKQFKTWIYIIEYLAFLSGDNYLLYFLIFWGSDLLKLFHPESIKIISNKLKKISSY